MLQETERSIWQETTNLFDTKKYTFGNHWTYNFLNDPKRLGFVLSRYKFASKMIGNVEKILELGCSDGIGTSILSENCSSFVGVDLDCSAIESSRKNYPDSKQLFIHDDFMGKFYGKFDAVVSLDVIEHIHTDYENEYFSTILNNIKSNGVCIIGTPNITADAYASVASKLGHINLFSQERLVNNLQRYFKKIFPFSMNDEIVHTGFAPMSHYLVCVCCMPKL